MKYNRTTISMLLFLTALILYAVVVSYFSAQLELEDSPSGTSVRLLSASRILLGLLFFVSMVLIIRNGIGKKLFRAAIIFGVAVKLILIFFSQPVLENDFNRYLWDGAVTAHGINPFVYSPEEDSLNQIDNQEIKSTLLDLKNEAGIYFDRINHPHLRTIYPMMSQLSFAAAYIVDSFNLTAWRLILFLFDILTLVLLIAISKELGKKFELILIYWLNPIILHEFFIASHMDLLTLPPLLLAAYFFIKKKEYFSTPFLAAAVGFKIFPLALIPLFFRNFLPNFKKIFLHTLLFVGLILILFYPVYSSPLNETFGLIKYSTSWTNNEAIYSIINEGFIFLRDNISHELNQPHLYTRITVVLIFGLIVLALTRKKIIDGDDLLKRILIIMSFMFFLSPTQFPWYFSWIVPFIVFDKKYSLLAYPILLPLYHLKINAEFLIYIQHIPIFIWFCFELYKDLKTRELLFSKS